MTKPLEPSEVPEEHRDSFYYKFQELKPVGNRTGLKIPRRCSNCSQAYLVLVTNIRGDLRRGRKMRKGLCRDCKGRVKTPEGYFWLWKPDHPNAMGGKYVAEHVYVMSEHLGRPIDTTTESVHHIDGDRSNNDISNLQLRVRYHGKGQAYECGDCGSHNIIAVALKD